MLADINETNKKGGNYNLHNLNLVSLQMFNGFPESSNYRHLVRLKNQENEEFYKKQTITLVEIPKFLKGGYESDNSMLAQCLSVIDGINKEQPLSVPEGSLFALLHEKAKLCVFTEEFLVSEVMILPAELIAEFKARLEATKASSQN